MDDDNILNFSCDCNIVLDSNLINRDEVIQSLCEEYVKYKLSSKSSEDTSIIIGNPDVGVSSKVQINSASEDELKMLPGVKLVHAKKIIQSRKHNDYIDSWDDLIKLGIDEISVENLKDLVIINKVSSKRVSSGRRILDL